jgi:hypothetical protein
VREAAVRAAMPICMSAQGFTAFMNARWPHRPRPCPNGLKCCAGPQPLPPSFPPSRE